MIKVLDGEALLASMYYYEQFSKPIKLNFKEGLLIQVKYSNLDDSWKSFKFNVRTYSLEGTAKVIKH